MGAIENACCLLMARGHVRHRLHAVRDNSRASRGHCDGMGAHQLKKSKHTFAVKLNAFLADAHLSHFRCQRDVVHFMWTSMCFHLMRLMCVWRLMHRKWLSARFAPTLKAYSRITTQASSQPVQNTIMPPRKATGNKSDQRKILYCNSLPFAVLQLRMPANRQTADKQRNVTERWVEVGHPIIIIIIIIVCALPNVYCYHYRNVRYVCSALSQCATLKPISNMHAI